MKETNSKLKILLEEVEVLQNELTGLEEVVPKKEESLLLDKDEVKKDISNLEVSIVDENVRIFCTIHLYKKLNIASFGFV